MGLIHRLPPQEHKSIHERAGSFSSIQTPAIRPLSTELINPKPMYKRASLLRLPTEVRLAILQYLVEQGQYIRLYIEYLHGRSTVLQ